VKLFAQTLPGGLTSTATCAVVIPPLSFCNILADTICVYSHLHLLEEMALLWLLPYPTRPC
jgi:hypothetical protein